MRILKHGNLKPRKFICFNCGCEFVADVKEYGLIQCATSVLWYCANCPECNVETTDSAPWEDNND